MPASRRSCAGLTHRGDVLTFWVPSLSRRVSFTSGPTPTIGTSANSKTDPLLDPLRKEPRFQSVMREFETFRTDRRPRSAADYTNMPNKEPRRLLVAAFDPERPDGFLLTGYPAGVELTFPTYARPLPWGDRFIFATCSERAAGPG